MKRTGQKLRIVAGPVASRRRPRRGTPRPGGAPRRPVKATLKEVLQERVGASASVPREDTLSVDSGSPPSNGAEAPASTTPVYQQEAARASTTPGYQPIDQEEAAASTYEETAAAQHTIASSPAPPAVTEPAAPVQHVFPALARPQPATDPKAPYVPAFGELLVKQARPILASPQPARGQKAPPVPSLGEILIERKLVTPEQLRTAMDRHWRTRRRLGLVLVELGLCDRRRRPRSLERPTRSPLHAG